jgi:hypothetical protein
VLTEPGDETQGLVINDLAELRVLSKALVVGKFEGDGADVVWGSPVLAEIQARLLTALSAREDGWESWAVADEKPWVVTWVKARLHEVEVQGWWASAASEQRRQYVLTLCSPFRPSEDLLRELCNLGVTGS